MRTRMTLAVLAILSLGGCWEAPTALMPAAERDLVNLSGRYEKLADSQREAIEFARLSDRRLSVVRWKDGVQIEQLVASLDSADDLAPATLAGTARIYIVETVSAEGGGAVANYSIAMLDREDASNTQIVHLRPACASATRLIAQAGKDEGCRFSSYRAVRAATADLLRWLIDARVEPRSEVYTRSQNGR